MTDPTRDSLDADIDLMRDVYMLPSQRESYDRIIQAALSARAQGEACGTCNGAGLIGGCSGQTAESFEMDSEPCPDCATPAVRAVDVDAAFSDGVILALQVMTGAGDMGGPDYEELLNAAGAVKVYRRAEAEGMLELSGLAEYVALETHRPSAEFRAALTQPEAE